MYLQKVEAAIKIYSCKEHLYTQYRYALTHGYAPENAGYEARKNEFWIDDRLVALNHGVNEEVGRTGQ